MQGLVIKNTGSWYTVKTDDGRIVDSKIKGSFRLKGIRSTSPVAVGDRVQLVTNQEGTAFISAIHDRKNYIIRKSSNLSKQSHILAANIDQALLIVTVNRPQTSTTFIDRFLASAEAYRIPVVLVLRTAEISNAHNAGMHTTTFSEMLELPEGGWVIDTPGIKGFGTFDIERTELSSYFKEIFAFSKGCRFNNCTHTHEPGCAVLQALNDHYIAQSRYQSYLSMLDDKDESKYREAY